ANRFVATPAYAALSGAGFSVAAGGFAGGVTAQGLAGQNDIAYLYGSAGGGDTLVGTPAASYLAGAGFLNRALGFGTVWGFGQGPNDLAYLYDSPGGDTFTGAGNLASLPGTGYAIDVQSFARVIAYGVAGAGHHLALGATNFL